jgi:HK97 family phage major capsid protein
MDLDVRESCDGINRLRVHRVKPDAVRLEARKSENRPRARKAQLRSLSAARLSQRSFALTFSTQLARRKFMAKLPQITGIQRRGFVLNREAIDESARTVTLSFSSGTPVRRWFGWEILSHDKGAVDLDRINNRGALLLNHDPDKQIGVVEEATVSGGKGRAVVRFSESALGAEIFNDVKAGIRANVSVGYEVRKVEPAGKIEGEESFRVTQWEPLELSIVSIPADKRVGVGRSKGNQFMDTDLDSPEIQEGENQLHRELVAIGRAAMGAGLKDGPVLAQRAIVAGDSVETFRKLIMARMKNAEPLGEHERRPEFRSETRNVSQGLWTRENCIGLSEDECGNFSIVRALGQIARNGRLDGLEGEASRAAEKLYGRSAPGPGFTIPLDVLIHQQRAIQNRTLTAGSNTAGGFLVASEMLTESFVDKLRNRAVIAETGARILTGLRGDIVIPKLTGDVTASWLTETATVSDSDLTLGELVLTPNRVAATNKFSKQLAMQTGLDVETLVRDNMAKQIALSWDLKAIAGSGNAAEPLGILNTSGLSTAVTFGAAATWAKVVEFETNLAANNADSGSIAFIVSTATRGKWKTAQKVSGQAVFLWENDTVNGYRAFATNQIPSGDKVIFGNFADMIIGMWGGMDVVVDSYSLATSNQIRVTSQLHCDIGLQRPTSFVISTDSGAQ